LLNGDYRTGYALLLISSALALASLIVARINFPIPSRLEEGQTAPAPGLGQSYLLYMAAGAYFAAGLMSYELVAYHLATAKIVSEHSIPMFLAFSTGCGVIASLILGKLYDRAALPTLLAAVFLSSLFSPFALFGGFPAALIGMVFWGIGYATQDTLLKAVVASALPEGKRNFAFGLFYAGYGIGWLVGSIATGLLYEQSRLGLVIFAVVSQLISLPLFVVAERQKSPS
jgi:predicted MFS family arabinose efflux permease